MIALRLGDRLIGVASFSILARLLTPEDYGIVALAMSVVAIVGLAGEWGVETAVVQRRGYDRGYYDTAWTVRVIAAAILSVLVCIVALPASRLFAEPRIEPVLYWLAFGLVVASFENIGTVDFVKTLEYRRELVYRLTIRVMGAILAGGLAFAWRSYWALVASTIFAAGAKVVLSYRFHPFRPRFSLAHFSGLFKFTRWVFVRNMFQGANDHAANIILGRSVGVGQLSFFTFARELSAIVATDFYAPTRKALFPAYAAVNNDMATLKRLTIDSSSLMMLIGLPLSAGLGVVAPDAVHVLLGDRWFPVITPLRILCVAGCVGSAIAGATVLYDAMGRPDTVAKLAALRFAVVVPLLAVGATVAGVVGAAWAMVATACVTQVFNWCVVKSRLDLSGKEIRRHFTRPVVATAIMVLAVLAVQDVLPDGGSFASSLFRLVAGIVAGGLVYVLSLVTLWRIAGKPEGAERHVLELLGVIGKRVVFWRARVTGGGS